MRAGSLLLTLSLVAVALAGCADAPEEDVQDTVEETVPPVLGKVVPVEVAGLMGFTESVVDAAIGYTNDLYEPTMDVCDDGSIYITGHTILVDTTGAPVFGSHDGGETWEQLPFTADAQTPAGMHGATPPPSDEIFLSCGDDGWLYGVDITLATFPVNAWSGSGAEHAYHNPNAYDRASSTASVCGAAGVNDRPWGAYANGKLLLVNNPGGGSAPLGRVEVGVMDVPPSLPYGVANPATGPTWNYCATVGGSIPGIPDIRDDHLFAAPQILGGKLIVVVGNANDVMDVEVREVFANTNTGGGTMNNGHVVFDKPGDLFVGVRNNTEENGAGERIGKLHLAVSTDNATSFVERTLVLDAPASSMYLDGNDYGPGALLTWAQEGDDGTDWYAAHLFVGADGGPVVENVSLILKDGPGPSAHVQGAALGPDGRAYMSMFNGGYGPTDGATPLSVWIQEDGPTMPIDALAVAVEPMEA